MWVITWGSKFDTAWTWWWLLPNICLDFFASSSFLPRAMFSSSWISAWGGSPTITMLSKRCDGSLMHLLPCSNNNKKRTEALWSSTFATITSPTSFKMLGYFSSRQSAVGQIVARAYITYLSIALKIGFQKNPKGKQIVYAGVINTYTLA